MRFALILALVATSAVARPLTTCGSQEEYDRALCAYQNRTFGEAERLFRELAAKKGENPKTIRAQYFLARTLMKRGRYSEASAVLIRIYELDKPFYDAWNCDFLLGECRKAQGKSG